MLDTLIIHIPIRDEFVRRQGNTFSIIGDVADYQIRAVPTYLKRDLDTGQVTWGELKHVYEALPSSYSNMAIKFFHITNNCNPYISLNASTKILQGHNIYGGESVKNLASEMLAMLRDHYPVFFAALDVQNASISRIDSTYSVALPSERLIQPCLRFLANISNGQRRNDTDRCDYFNTVYWGGATSRLGGAKAYGKHCDVMREVVQLKRDVMRGSTNAKQKLTVFTDDLLDWSSKLLRFEATTKRRKLEQLGLPTNLWLFIEHQQNKERDVLARLWQLWFMPIIQAIKGDVTMESYDDAKIYDLCREKLKTYTKSGKLSYTKANNAFNFYQLLKANGWDDVKARYNSRTFQINVKSLVDIGIPKALLQNLFEQQTKAIPMVELVQFDFNKQCPDGYEPPISSHINDFNHYLPKKPNLRLVA